MSDLEGSNKSPVLRYSAEKYLNYRTIQFE